MLAEAEAGHNWLKGLPEVEPPASLITNILASTSGVDTQRLRTSASQRQSRISWWEQVQASFLEPMLGMIRQPRFAMSFGMAFFALSVGLTVAGVKPADLREVSLKPSAVRHSYYNTQARVVRYYDNVKVVYQLQSMLNEFRRTAPAEPGPATKKDHKNDTTQQPEQKQERNYSQTGTQLILASAHVGPCLKCCDLPVVSVTTDRRFV
jgi:hypothetical protein